MIIAQLVIVFADKKSEALLFDESLMATTQKHNATKFCCTVARANMQALSIEVNSPGFMATLQVLEPLFDKSLMAKA